MYVITSDGIPIYNSATPVPGYKVVSPKLSVSKGSAGKLTFTIPPTNINQNVPVDLASTILVYKNGVELWEGRILSEESDFRNNRKVTCEGSFGYFNDSVQPLQHYVNDSVAQYLEALIAFHNRQVSDNRKFQIGNVDVTSESYAKDRYTNYESTMDCISDMNENLKGHIRIRKVNGIRYVDYLSDEYERDTNQVIQFGKNLLDFSTNFDLDDLATVIVPLGAALDPSPVEDMSIPRTIESVNDGKNYLESDSAIDTYGRIVKTVEYSEITDLNQLKTEGQKYLTDHQFSSMKLTCDAFDLKDIGVNVDDLRLLDRVRVLSPFHGMDRQFIITQIDYDLADLSGNKYKLEANIDNQVIKSVTNILSEQKDTSTIISMATSAATGSATEAATAAAIQTITPLLDTKVDKVHGKDLSTNDFTDAYKSKLDSLYGWTLVKSEIGATTIALPANFNELRVKVCVNQNRADCYSFIILPDDLSDSANTSFRDGWISGSYNEGIVILFTKKESVELNAAQVNGTDCLATSEIVVHYR